MIVLTNTESCVWVQVHLQLRRRHQPRELLVHPDAPIHAQLQLELQDAGLVVSARFGGESIRQGDKFQDRGMDSGAMILVAVVSIDNLTDEEYCELEPELQGELGGLLG